VKGANILIYWELFISFCWVGVFCVGGGYASVPLIQHQVIELHHWLTMPEFLDIFAISQMTPGPIGINAATFVGTKVAGIGGAISATLGFVFPSFIIMIVLAKLLAKYGDLGAIRGILNGLRPAVIGLIASAGVMFFTLAIWNTQKIPASLASTDLAGLLVLVAAFIAVRKKIFGVIQTLIAAGVLNLLLSFIIK